MVYPISTVELGKGPAKPCPHAYEYRESWPIDRDGQASYEPLKTNLCAITNIMGVGESDILGGRYVRANVPAPKADTGWMDLDLENFEDQILSPPYQSGACPARGPPPFRLTGLGLIGFSIIRIENGDVGGLLSNYVSVKRLTGPPTDRGSAQQGLHGAFERLHGERFAENGGLVQHIAAGLEDFRGVAADEDDLEVGAQLESGLGDLHPGDAAG